jgi:hypothetical protein
MDDPRTILNDAFFDRTPNHTGEWIKANPAFQNCLRLIRVEDFAPESKMKIIMRSDLSRAVAFLTPKDK